MNPKLLIIDDDEEIRTQMKWAVARDYDVLLAEDRATALKSFAQNRPPVVLLDLGLPPHPNSPQEGLAALAEILGLNKGTKVIIVSGQGEKKNALEAVGVGAYDFVTKPIELEEIKIILKRAFHVAGLEKEFRELQRQMPAEAFEGMLGTCPAMQHVFN